MRTLSLSFQAGETIEVFDIKNMFMLLETVAAVDVQLLRNGAEITLARNMEFGFWTKPKDGFTSVRITSASAQTIKCLLSEGDAGYTRMTGVVQILNQQGAIAQSQASVTNANNVILPANATRRYLNIQNNSAAGVLRVKLNGVAASATSGFRIKAGLSYEFQGYVCAGAIHAFMETADATAANVEIAEG